MREITIDFNLSEPLPDDTQAGYIGENNATKLIVRPSEEMLNSGCVFLVAVFLSKGEIIRSEQFEPTEMLEIMLGANLTRDHYLSMQLEGYSEENMLVFKSPMISKIQFMPSISGKATESNADDYLFGTQVELNTNARHTHQNAEILNGITQSNGAIAYNGKPICDCEVIKEKILWIKDEYIEPWFDSEKCIKMSLILYGEYKNLKSYENMNVKSIKLNISKDTYPTWLDLKDIIIYDRNSPYTIFYHTPYYDNDLGGVVICTMVFEFSGNTIVRELNAYRLNGIRIVYTENTPEQI